MYGNFAILFIIPTAPPKFNLSRKSAEKAAISVAVASMYVMAANKNRPVNGAAKCRGVSIQYININGSFPERLTLCFGREKQVCKNTAAVGHEPAGIRRDRAAIDKRMVGGSDI